MLASLLVFADEIYDPCRREAQGALLTSLRTSGAGREVHVAEL